MLMHPLLNRKTKNRWATIIEYLPLRLRINRLNA